MSLMTLSYITPSGTIENAGVVLLSAKELLTQQITIEAENLSNADTIGFKGLLLGGLESVYKNPQVGANSPAVSYVQGDVVKRDFSQGPLKQTGNIYDFALNGSGYFIIQAGDTKQFTRDGRFRLDNNGNLVTLDGSMVQGDGGTINIAPYTHFSVGRDGTILGFDNAGIQTIVGKIKVSRFQDDQNDLDYVGAGRFLAKGDEMPIDSTTQVLGGFLEQSNVSPIAGSIKLMRIMQIYEEAQRVTEMHDEALSRTINIRTSG